MIGSVSSRNFSLASYTAAASAFATLISASESDAAVISYDNGGAGWTSVNADGTLLSLNLNGEVRTDGSTPDNHQFSFVYDLTEGGESGQPDAEKLKVAANPNLEGTSLSPLVNGMPLSGGTTIGAGSNTPTEPNATLIGTLGGKPGGSWTPGQRAYLGLAFESNGAHHYGWADLTVNNLQSVTLHEYAYETAPGMDIITPVPEPEMSTLMMAAGAGGVIALRHRRQRMSKAASK